MSNDFGRFLKDRRQEKGLTQKELATALFVSSSAVSKWEKNSARPDIALLPKLSELLGVTEHELITASIDLSLRKEKSQAKKWRTFSTAWSLFFYISYATALLVCLICNLAIDKKLSWFWLVLASLTLAFTLTNVPSLIKRRRLLILPLCCLSALLLLLAVCAIYTHGKWFFVASLSILLGYAIVFTPIYIAKFPVFARVKKYNDFLSVAVNFVLLNILLIVTNSFALTEGYTTQRWYFPVALPIVFCSFAVLNLLLCVRFLRINRAFKTSLLLTLVALFLYIPPLFLSKRHPILQRELNIFNADFSRWTTTTIDNNVHCIVFLTLIALALVFFLVGCLRKCKK